MVGFGVWGSSFRLYGLGFRGTVRRNCVEGGECFPRHGLQSTFQVKQLPCTLDLISKPTVQVHLSLYGVSLAPLEGETIETSYVRPIGELHGIIQRSAIVTINDDPLFNGLDHTAMSYSVVVNKVARELRAKGCLVFTTSSLWFRV